MALHTNELRLGNFLQHVKYPDQIFTVKGITQTSIEIESGSLSGYLEWKNTEQDISGIPLTFDRFEKFGFKWNQKHCSYTLNNIVLIQWDGCIFKLMSDDGIDVSLEYVHKLQNIYFSLTGTELEIQIP